MKRLHSPSRAVAALMLVINCVCAEEIQTVTIQTPSTAAPTQNKLTALSQPSSSRETMLRDADGLIKNGQPEKAYALLAPREFDLAGDVRFDYLLGIAALDSGKPDKATLAFERVLTVDPNFAGARLDMARAYYQLGDFTRAKQEFDIVMRQNPPSGAKETIQKYLDAIKNTESSALTRITGYAEGVLGRDSNVNTGTGASISVASLSPGLAALITGMTGNLNPQILPSQRADSYYGMNAGAEISHSLNADWQIYAGLDGRQHGNLVQTPFDSSGTDVRVGAMRTQGKHVLKLSLTGGQTYLANSMRRDTTGVNAQWQYTVSPSTQISTFAQYDQNRAAGSPSTAPGTDARITGNTDLIIAGAGWLHAVSGGSQLIFASIYTGKELDKAPAIQPPDGQKRFDGIRTGIQANISEQVDRYASLGWQHAIFSRPNGFIVNNGQRNEYQYDLTAGAIWHLDKLWSVKPQVAVYKKQSNLAIYSYDRTDVSLTLRRDFK